MEHDNIGRGKSLLLTSAIVAILAPLLKEQIQPAALLEGWGLAALLPFLRPAWEAFQHVTAHVLGVEAHEALQERRHAAIEDLSKVTGDTIASLLRRVAHELPGGSERRALERIAAGASERWRNLPVAPIEEAELRELFSRPWDQLSLTSPLPVETAGQPVSPDEQA